jgi:two-component system, chemotaxis family, sensor kinase CheA
MERQAELLLSVMHVEPQMLREFIEDAHTELETINALLREGRSAVLSFPDRNIFYSHLAEDIFKSVHTIKGTAAMLRIDYFAAAANRFEEKLAALRGRTVLDGSDFVPIVLELSEMVDSLAEIRDVLTRFAEAQRSLKTASGGASDTEALAALVTRFVDDLAEKSGKKVVVAFHAPGDLAIPFKYKSALRNVMAQLVRNSIVHGIETPAERQVAGKPAEGRIMVAARQNNGNLEFLFKDDGRGIDHKRVIERVQELARSEPAILEPLIDREQNRWKPDALEQMIFHPGFSTADQMSEDAGRGIGMSAVRDMLARLGGRIWLRQQQGQFCQFQIVLPNGS